jgi:transposase InsO family protein
LDQGQNQGNLLRLLWFFTNSVAERPNTRFLRLVEHEILLIMVHGRRQILWFGVTSHPTAEWIANQLTQACGWEQAPRYLIRDRDVTYGEIFVRRVRSLGIRDRPASPRSPWQNGFAERLIGSIRRECLDHVVAFGEQHLRHVLLSYMKYYNRASEHPSVYVVEEKRLC